MEDSSVEGAIVNMSEWTLGGDVNEQSHMTRL
jgi:hypothetical protein